MKHMERKPWMDNEPWLIDARELLKHETTGNRMGEMLVVGKGYILDAPIVDSRKYSQQEGRWKGAGMGDYACSHCGEVVGKRTKYCPECGFRNMSDMEVEEDVRRREEGLEL